MIRKWVHLLFVLTITLIVSACGGGSSETETISEDNEHSDSSIENNPGDSGMDYAILLDGLLANSITYPCKKSGGFTSIYSADADINNLDSEEIKGFIGFNYNVEVNQFTVVLSNKDSSNQAADTFECNQISQTGSLSVDQIHLSWNYNGVNVSMTLN